MMGTSEIKATGRSAINSQRTVPYVPAQKWGRDLNLQSLAGIYAAKSQRTLHTVSYYYIHSSKYKGLGTKKKNHFFSFTIQKKTICWTQKYTQRNENVI